MQNRAYTGYFGSGKTLNACWDLITAMYKGRHVISNTPIEGYVKLRPFGKLKHVKAEFISSGTEYQKALAYRENATFFTDEASVFFPSMFWSKLPSEIIVKFHQVRKYRCSFWYTTQVLNHTVKRLRDLTHVVYVCNSFRFMGIGQRCYRLRKFRPEFFYGQKELNDKNKRRYFLGSRTLYPSQQRKVFKAYDTEYVIDMSAMMKVQGFYQPTFSKTAKERLKEAIELKEIEAIKEADNNREGLEPVGKVDNLPIL